MNFARIIIKHSRNNLKLEWSSAAVRRHSTINTPNLSISAMQRSYDSFKNNTSTKLERKLQNLESGALSTPIKLAQKIATGSSSLAAAAAKIGTTNVPLSTINKKRKNRSRKPDAAALGFFNVTAFSTAEEYDLEQLYIALRQQELYEPKKFFSTDNLGVEQDVLYVTAKYIVDEEPRDIFFFREGSVVMWNFNDIETNNVISFLRPFEKEPYLRALVRSESEVMHYTYIPSSTIDIEGDLVASGDMESVKAFFQSGKFFLTCGDDSFFPKYTFSNALSTSIKLGIWEATLDRYIDSMAFLTSDMKNGRRIRISRADVLRKTGELLALRHVINLSSDLLDTPDFYWDREELETLYLQVCNYFSISRRTKVMNEKINHCVELAELISHNLSEAHNTRLEWMIIILIMIEVGFEIIHYLDRYYVKEETTTYEDDSVKNAPMRAH